MATLDASTFAIVGESFTGYNSTPTEIAVSPDGSRVYVTNAFAYFDTGTVSVIDAVTHTVISTIKVEKNPYGIAVSPDNKRVYVTNQGSGTLSVIDAASEKVVSTIAVEPNPMAVVASHDGKYVYAADRDGNVSVIDVLTNGIIKTIHAGAWPIAIAISPDDKNVYVVNEDSQTVTVIDTKSQAGVATINMPNPQEPFSVSVSPDGKKIYVVNQNGFISVIDAASNLVMTSVKTPLGALSSGSFISSGIGCNSVPLTFTITVNPILPPQVITTGTLQPFRTIYGEASAQAYVVTKATNLTSDLIINAPSGFEISTDNTVFTSSLTLKPDANGTIPATPIYVRLDRVSAAGAYHGKITFSATGITGVTSEVSGTVAPAPLTITANPVAKTYGNVLNSGLSTSQFTTEGLKNDETVGSIIFTYGPGSPATALPGIYAGAVIPSDATGGTFNADNYSISYLPADLTVNAAVLTITADNETKAAGTPNPELTVTYNGFVNDDGPAKLSSSVKIYTAVTLTTPAGQYPITASDALLPGYIISYLPGVFTVYPRDHIVTIPNAFSPNGDGTNDAWNIQNLQYYPYCTVDLFNRYGQRLYHSIGYSKAWDGTYEGKSLSGGTYYYIINLHDGSNIVSGYVCLIR